MSFIPELELQGAEKTQYSSLVDKVRHMSSSQVMRLAENYAGKSKTGEALVLYSLVYNRIEDGMSDKDLNVCALARLKAGRVYYEQANYTSALEMFVDGVAISEKCKKPLHAARLYNNIGNVYCVFLEYEKGIDYYLKALEYCRKVPDRDTEHDIAINAAGISTFLKKIDDARKFYRISEKTKNTADPVDVFMSGYTKSLMMMLEGNFNYAANRLAWLAGYAQRMKMEPKYKCFAYQELSNAYRGMGYRDSVLKYLNLCYSEADKNNLQHTFVEAIKDMSAYYESVGDLVSANRFKSRYLAIKDSVYNIRRFDEIKNNLFTYEVNKTYKEMDDLRTRVSERAQTIRIQRMLMLAVVAVLLTMTVFLVVVLRQKKKINRSYADLYTVNRDFIADQEELTARVHKGLDVLKEKELQIESLKTEIGKVKGTSAAGGEYDAVKYRKSNLSEEKRAALADQIQNVMENTLAFCDCDFTLDTLAGMVGSNSKYVSQVINDSFNKNFNSYINPFRIHLACKRFSDVEKYGQYTLKAIASSVGFRSYTSFAGVFKQITGITPSLYQKMAHEGVNERK